MIRTTISRIKRVWAFTFAPRLLRDPRYTPGKFKILANLKSTSSTDGGVNEASHKYEETIQPKRGISDNYLTTDNLAMSESIDKIAKRHGAPPLYRSSSACRCDECSRVITEIFGTETKPKESNPDKEVKAALDGGRSKFIDGSIERPKIHGILNKTQFTAKNAVNRGISKKPATSANTGDVDIENDLSYKNNNYKTILWYEVVTNECKEKNLVTSEKNEEIIDEMYTNLYDVVPEENETNLTVSDNVCIPDPKEISDWDEVYETGLGENSVSSELNDTINIYNVPKRPGNSFDYTSLETKHHTCIPRNADKIFEESSFEDDNLLLASTNKQDDQKLTQKIEKISETPLVPTEKPPLDGFQIPPKVLNKVEKTENTLDEVAMRCLTTPCDEIDKILLQEMENFGIPLSVQKPACGIKMEDNMQATLNKPKKPVPQKEVEFSKPKPEIISKEELSGLQIDSDSDPQVATESNKTKINAKLVEKDEEPLTEHKAQYVTTEGRTKWLHWRVDKNKDASDERKQGTGQNETVERENKCFADTIFEKDQLHPKHVLTCNETCPISPKPLMTSNALKRFEDTEVIFERDFYEHGNLQKEDYMRLVSLLEEGGCKCPETSTVNNKTNNLNATLSSSSLSASIIPSKKMTNTPEIPLRVTDKPLDKVQQIDTDLSDWNVNPSDLLKKETLKSQKLGEEGVISIPQKNIHEAKEEFETVIDDSQDVTNEAYAIEATSEQMQATTEQLQAASEQLKVTCKQLKATSEKLLATSDQLYDSSDRLQAASENLYDTSEKLQDASLKLLDTSEKIENDMSMIINKLPYYFMKDQGIIQEEDCVNKSCGYNVIKVGPVNNVKNNLENPETNIPPTKLLTSYKKKEAPADIETSLNKVCPDYKQPDSQNQGLTQQAAAVSPQPQTLEPLPEINDNMKLSEIMKLVRKRNQMSIKAPKKDIPPLSRPMHIPPSFNMPTTVPPSQPMHRVCPPPKSPRNKPKLNCTCIDTYESGIDEACIEQEELDTAVLSKENEPRDFTEDIIRQIQSLGTQVEDTYRRRKVDILESVMLAKSCNKTKYYRGKSYDPWCPIPSWPYPKKEQRQKTQCPKDGCKVPPPRSILDQPCGLKPCETFPAFPKRTFTLLDYYPVSLGKHKVIDFGDF